MKIKCDFVFCEVEESAPMYLDGASFDIHLVCWFKGLDLKVKQGQIAKEYAEDRKRTLCTKFPDDPTIIEFRKVYIPLLEKSSGNK